MFHGEALPPRSRLAVCSALALLACLFTPTPLHPQTAHFSYATQVMAGGFAGPAGMAVDYSGNVFVADTGGNEVKEIAPGCGSASCAKTVGGGFNAPQAVAVDLYDNVYVADTGNNAIKRIPAGCLTSSCVTRIGGGFNAPAGIAVNNSGDVWISDTSNNQIKRTYSTCASAACVAIVAASGLNAPHGIALDANANLFVADTGNNAVKELPNAYICYECVWTLGAGFSSPFAVAIPQNEPSTPVYQSGNETIEVADYGNNALKSVAATSTCTDSSCVTTTIVTGLDGPSGVTADRYGNIYVSDTYNQAVKQVNQAIVSFLNRHVNRTSGTASLTYTFDSAGSIQTPKILNSSARGLNFTDAGTGTCNSFGSSHVYAQGDTCTVDVLFAPKAARLQFGAVTLRNPAGTTIATAMIQGNAIAPETFLPGPLTATALGGGLATPSGVAVDVLGNVYVADTSDNAVKEIPAGCFSASCTTLVGGGFSGPSGVAVDSGGTVYVADTNNDQLKEIPPGCTSAACTVILGGTFLSPISVAVDISGSIYVATSYNGVYRTHPGCTSTSCVIHTNLAAQAFGIAVDSRFNVYETVNNGVEESPVGWDGNQVPLTNFFNAGAIATDTYGNLYVGDPSYGALREIPPGCESYECSTALVNSVPHGIATDGLGNIYYTDNNSYVTKIRFAGLNFAPSPVGSLSSYGLQILSVKNIGNDNLTVTPPVSGSNPTLSDGFSLDPSSTCPVTTPASIPFPMSPGYSCSYAVNTTPPTPGVYSGTLVFNDNSLNPAGSGSVTHTVALSGLGILPPTMTSPAPGSTLSGSAVTFKWNPGGGVQQFKLKVGTSHASYDLYNGTPTTSTSAALSGIPTNGVLLYVRLYYEVNSVWKYLDYSYTEAGTVMPPALTSPAPGTALTGASATFTWSPGRGPAKYQLKIGTTGHGSYDIYNGTPSTDTSVTVTNLPTYGQLLYVRLYYELNVAWLYIDYSYTAAGSLTPPAITAPTPGSTLVTSSATFSWSPGSGPIAYQLKVGDTGVGSSDIYLGSSTTATSAAVTNIPASGKKLYVRLLYKFGTTWKGIDYTYTEK